MVKKIENVNQYFTKGNDLWLLNKNGELYFNSKLEETNVLVIGNYKDSHFLFISFENKNVILNTLNQEVLKTGTITPQFIVAEDTFLALEYSSDYSQKRLITYNIKNQKKDMLIERFEGSLSLFAEKKIFSITENNILKCIDVDSLRGEHWEINLASFGKIRELLGIVNNLLWVTCYLKESLTKTYHTLLALDVKTGEIIFSRNDMPYFHSSACVLNESNNTIISILRRFDQTFFLELDALSGNIIREQQLTELEEKGFVFGGANNLTLYKDKLYMVVTAVKTIFGKTLAILDLSDLSIPWISKVTEGKATISRDPEVTDTHLYVLDTENTLHVFEKENM